MGDRFCVARANRTQALVESILLAVAAASLAAGRYRCCALLLSLAFAVSTFLPISTLPSPLVLAFAFGAPSSPYHLRPVPACSRRGPIRSTRCAARPLDGRSLVLHPDVALVLQAALSVVLVAGATMLGRSLSKCSIRTSPTRCRTASSSHQSSASTTPCRS